MSTSTAVPASIADHEALARACLSEVAYDYCAGGAGAEATVQENIAAFRQWRLVPRALTPAPAADALATTVLGRPVAVPIGISPVSLQAMTHPDAEVGLAVGAARTGGCMVRSAFASEPVGALAAAAPDLVLLQQIYLFRDPDLTRSVVDAAVDGGCAGLVVTVDTPVQGIRARDRRRAHDRFAAHRPALVDGAAFATLVARHPARDPARVLAEQFPHPATWSDLECFCAEAPLPVLVKGVQHPDDARRSTEAGAAGVVVSNHGGRQLDGAIGAIEALGEIGARRAPGTSVLFDSGVRSGIDAFIALALGADVVFVGRPAIWGLAHGGADGVACVLGGIVEELAHAVALTGAGRAAAAGPHHLRRTAGP